MAFDLTDKDIQGQVLVLIRGLSTTEERIKRLNDIGISFNACENEDAWVLLSCLTAWKLASFNVFQYGGDRLANHLGYKVDVPDAGEVLQRVVGDGWGDVFGPEDYE